MFKITKATVGDIPLIRNLTFRIWPQTYASIISPEQIEYMLDWMYSESSLKQQMEEGAQFIIVEDDQVPVGFASYQETDHGLYKLHKIYILPSQQGKGAGRFVINQIIEDLKKKHAKALQLQVNRNNNAKLFYEILGFQVIGQADFDIGNGYFMNDYIMEKKLDN